jgi:peptidoglycan/xylan/chitin deacetylase (PgdA/CDA1 family)
MTGSEAAAGAAQRPGPGGSSRDLVGYGGVWPRLVWPNGARLAVSLNINLEEGAEWQVGDGDPTSERIGEVLSVVAPGTRDMGQEQIFAYGTRAGIWRILEALRDRAMPATWLCCGRAVERSPALLAALVRDGHEAAVHGWRWRPHADYTSREAEAADLDRCIAVMTAAGAPHPVGFFCRGAESAWTRALLRERGFLYTSNAFDDDLPYWDRAGAKPLLVVPYALDANDMKFFHPNGFVTADAMVVYVADALDVLLGEAERGRARLLNIGFHLRIVGRPGRFAALARILDRLQALGDRIYIGTRADIARSFAASVPA